MRNIKIVLGIILILATTAVAQQKDELRAVKDELQAVKDGLQVVKDGLVNCTLKAQALEQQLATQTADINKFVADIKLVKTIAQLDSLKKVYGIIKEEPKIVKGK